MNIADFTYDLPDELIAQFPSPQRGASRLLKLMQGRGIEDSQFPDLVDELQSGDLLVLNNTKVIPARLHGQKETGGRVEILLERITGANQFVAQIRASKAPKPGQVLHVDGDDSARLMVTGRRDTFFELESNQQGSLFDWFERVGHMPLPPYIDRNDTAGDADRYQTVFAKEQGAVAAPTAGLHYDDALLARIRAKGVDIATVTLHVGAGTYQPVRVTKVEDHVMHSEYVDVNQQVCDQIKLTKERGGRIVAVGTTVVRSLETAAQATGDELIAPFQGDTDIFIYPGYQFKVIDLLQTNFHLPESTLLMLVSAFAGTEPIQQAYQHAIAQGYRFFSYGDAMLLEKSTA
ncbi:tRNA preQ1(34) S-adenosylmethionine ribosyltransferase-isomerase QueA [Arenicella xantha]|uniref:S-adenosylmethionine:tRNA ribosyltransferase-isomerase n=1 Tax=Arenicella xantha TaxID=644221 RepID=A0A395JMD8_9GAMM|nr:tRNA preQ1(34) S-adenosylmethionine ribosyltransferase-isomerase QueA [Arenicella xantha]RBP50774.1 S-adenosylmethionine:tRNA ribosyltransferase-isomerase [Arenicella xantha]